MHVLMHRATLCHISAIKLAYEKVSRCQLYIFPYRITDVNITHLFASRILEKYKCLNSIYIPK